jgi:hypothetical protein
MYTTEGGRCESKEEERKVVGRRFIYPGGTWGLPNNARSEVTCVRSVRRHIALLHVGLSTGKELTQLLCVGNSTKAKDPMHASTVTDDRLRLPQAKMT